MIHLSLNSGSFQSHRPLDLADNPDKQAPHFHWNLHAQALFIFKFSFVFLQMSLFPRCMPLFLGYMSAHLWTLSPWDEPSVTEPRFFFSLTDH